MKRIVFLFLILLSVLVACPFFTAAEGDPQMLAEAVLTYEGMSARTVNNAGVRSLYTADMTAVAELEALGYDVHIGALMGIAEYNGKSYCNIGNGDSAAEMRVTAENGRIVVDASSRYAANSAAAIVYATNNEALSAEKDYATDLYVKKYAESGRTYQSFAFTTVYGEGDANADMYNIQLCYRGFVAVFDDNNLVYLSYENASGENFGDQLSLCHLANYFVNFSDLGHESNALLNAILREKTSSPVQGELFTDDFSVYGNAASIDENGVLLLPTATGRTEYTAFTEYFTVKIDAKVSGIYAISMRMAQNTTQWGDVQIVNSSVDGYGKLLHGAYYSFNKNGEPATAYEKDYLPMVHLYLTEGENLLYVNARCAIGIYSMKYELTTELSADVVHAVTEKTGNSGVVTNSDYHIYTETDGAYFTVTATLPESGIYRIGALASSNGAGENGFILKEYTNGSEITLGSYKKSGRWYGQQGNCDYDDISFGEVYLEAGAHTFRVYASRTNGRLALNGLHFDLQTASVQRTVTVTDAGYYRISLPLLGRGISQAAMLYDRLVSPYGGEADVPVAYKETATAWGDGIRQNEARFASVYLSAGTHTFSFVFDDGVNIRAGEPALTLLSTVETIPTVDGFEVFTDGFECVGSGFTETAGGSLVLPATARANFSLGNNSGSFIRFTATVSYTGYYDIAVKASQASGQYGEVALISETASEYSTLAHAGFYSLPQSSSTEASGKSYVKMFTVYMKAGENSFRLFSNYDLGVYSVQGRLSQKTSDGDSIGLATQANGSGIQASGTAYGYYTTQTVGSWFGVKMKAPSAGDYRVIALCANDASKNQSTSVSVYLDRTAGSVLLSTYSQNGRFSGTQGYVEHIAIDCGSVTLSENEEITLRLVNTDGNRISLNSFTLVPVTNARSVTVEANGEDTYSVSVTLENAKNGDGVWLYDVTGDPQYLAYARVENDAVCFGDIPLSAGAHTLRVIADGDATVTAAFSSTAPITVVFKDGKSTLSAIYEKGAPLTLPESLLRDHCRITLSDENGAPIFVGMTVTASMTVSVMYERIGCEVLGSEMQAYGNAALLSDSETLSIPGDSGRTYSASTSYATAKITVDVAGVYGIRMRYSAVGSGGYDTVVYFYNETYTGDKVYQSPNMVAGTAAFGALTDEEKAKAYPEEYTHYIFLNKGDNTVYIHTRSAGSSFAVYSLLAELCVDMTSGVSVNAETATNVTNVEGLGSDVGLETTKTKGLLLRRGDSFDISVSIPVAGIYDIYGMIGSTGTASAFTLYEKQGDTLRTIASVSGSFATGDYVSHEQTFIGYSYFTAGTHTLHFEVNDLKGTRFTMQNLQFVPNDQDYFAVTFRNYGENGTKSETVSFATGEAVTAPSSADAILSKQLVWQNEHGEAVDLTTVKESTTLYAVYIDREICEYTIYYGENFSESVTVNGYVGRPISAVFADPAGFEDSEAYKTTVYSDGRSVTYRYYRSFSGYTAAPLYPEAWPYEAPALLTAFDETHTTLYAFYDILSHIAYNEGETYTTAKVLTVSDLHVGAGYGTWRDTTMHTFYKGKSLCFEAGRTLTFPEETTITVAKETTSITVKSEGAVCRRASGGTEAVTKGKTLDMVTGEVLILPAGATVSFTARSYVDLPDNTAILFVDGISTWDRANIMVDRMLLEYTLESYEMILCLADMASNEYNTSENRKNRVDGYWQRLMLDYMTRLDYYEVPYFLVYANHDDVYDDEWFDTLGYSKEYILDLGDSISFVAKNYSDIPGRLLVDTTGTIPKEDLTEFVYGHDWGYGYDGPMSDLLYRTAVDLVSDKAMVYYASHYAMDNDKNLEALTKMDNFVCGLVGHTHYNVTTYFYGKPFYNDGNFSWNADEWGLVAWDSAYDETPSNNGSFGFMYLDIRTEANEMTIEVYMVYPEVDYGSATGTGGIYSTPHTFPAFYQKRISLRGEEWHRAYSMVYVGDVLINDEE